MSVIIKGGRVVDPASDRDGAFDVYIDGERIADCSTPEMARRLHQIRDTAIRIEDPVGGGVGVGNCQPMAVGPWPALGLADEAWL